MTCIFVYKQLYYFILNIVLLTDMEEIQLQKTQNQVIRIIL